MAPLSIVTAVAVVVGGWLFLRAIGGPRRAATRRRLVRLRHGAAHRTAGLSAWFPAVQRRWRSGAAGTRGGDGLPTLLEDIARGVRAGSSLRQACAEGTAALGDPATMGLATAVADAGRGQPLARAFTMWAEASTGPEERLAAGALALAATAGGPQARAVDGVAATLRERRALTAEIRAQSAQARLSAVVIGALPAVFLVWAIATDRRTAAFLVAGPAGWACLGTGLGLELVGALWMRRLLREAAR